MFNNIFFKKEKPIPGLLGLGGGVTGLSQSGPTEPPIGEELFETPGTYTWDAPGAAAASGIDIVVIGGGGGCALYPSNTTGGSGGGAAALSYKNNVPVTAGQELTITVGAFGRGSWGGSPSTIPSPTHSFVGNSAEDGTFSSVRNPGQPTAAPDSIVYAAGGSGSPGPAGGAGGSTRVGDGGGDGGPGGNQNGTTSYWSFGGGTGGYSGNGGTGGVWQAGGPYEVGASAAQPGSGGAGGAAMWASRTGVNVYGRGPSGAIDSPGSGGTTNKYGAGGSTSGAGGSGTKEAGQPGAVRIIWGPGRAFPDTATGIDGGPAPA